MKTNETLTWTEVNVASFPAPMAKQYKLMMQQRVEYQKAKEAFEAAFDAMWLKSKHNVAGMEPVLSYRFGKVSVALRSATAAKPARADKANLFTF